MEENVQIQTYINLNPLLKTETEVKVIRVAINGFGRIGRMILRAGYKQKGIKFVAINSRSTPTKTLAHLLKYDSVHGKIDADINYDDKHIFLNKTKIKTFQESDPEKLPWKKLKIDVVIDCTGHFLTKELASKHLTAGAKKVILSAPANDNEITTIVMGVNDHKLKKSDNIVSNASCTTNCFAPIVKIFHEKLGIRVGFMVTSHAYTSTQRTTDGSHKDLRRARAAAINIIPTTSGAAKAVMEVLPEIGCKLHSSAMRVPVADGSVIYFVCEVKKKTSAEYVNSLFKKAATMKRYQEIIEYTDEEMVSSDVIGNPASCVFDSLRTLVDGDLVKVVAWYDNEWGYSNRIIDLVRKMG